MEIKAAFYIDIDTIVFFPYIQTYIYNTIFLITSFSIPWTVLCEGNFDFLFVFYI